MWRQRFELELRLILSNALASPSGDFILYPSPPVRWTRGRKREVTHQQTCPNLGENAWDRKTFHYRDLTFWVLAFRVKIHEKCKSTNKTFLSFNLSQLVSNK